MNSVELWKGQFGDSYHERNRFTVDQVKPLFDRILDGVHVESVLEVGCGLGHNLMAIDARFRCGVEPNRAARTQAIMSYPSLIVTSATADDLPFKDDAFDLVLTCGLLIHIPPTDIHRVVEETARVSRRYVLAIEYAAVEEEEQAYRGQRDILWRRPYGKLFQAWADMSLVRWDDMDSGLYPGCCWWLLEK
jgi:SAM-dependent methyltransferase